MTYQLAQLGRSRITAPSSSILLRHTMVRVKSQIPLTPPLPLAATHSSIDGMIHTDQVHTQTKLAMNYSEDECEQESKKAKPIADRTRAQFQYFNASQEEPVSAPSITYDMLRSHGQPLDVTTRVFMETHFGQDFSRVRVHTDRRAAESARAVSALAYTSGENIAFAQDCYAPHTNAGKKLLAHELGHVVQQRNMDFIRNDGTVPRIFCWKIPQHQDIAKEILKEAEFQESFSRDAQTRIIEESDDMDLRIAAWLESIGVVTGAWEWPKGELANHAEDPNPAINTARMKSYLVNAINASNKGDVQDGFDDLGNALHVGQDKGAHEYKGGHKNPQQSKVADDLSKNTEGAKIAYDNTRFLLKSFLAGISPQKLSELKNYRMGRLRRFWTGLAQGVGRLLGSIF